MTRELVLASDNQEKLKELTALLSDSGFSVVGQGTLGVTPAEETGKTFVENAILKARNASLQTGHPAIADDSGLEVDALNGAPGVTSARFAGDHASDSDNVTKLLSRLEDIPWEDRNARFRCLMVYLRQADDPAPLICEGTWSGVVTKVPSGENGFGYDPIFWVPDEYCTAAELDSERKNGLSHRARALRVLVDRLKGREGDP
ncbi:MAG TPA: non-canonical purine NTP pyrophosphatase, RdgB/HAM1 family [Gammaproteobacteria bacterium]|nr:non-canonical purine NTP pyrophosphatase, RdgB/HAM1 family [Acidiferrobacteraceae bacterium]MDP6551637.1 RdgB/HAM1 family non-canonical purine NTP pyrophosphatase [Arenicellales bacterium]MDP6790621.1 RdgB/HAM1 family non-canonical purine NTP pyrophosphatase [Arenicellales bacterium]MDP6919201.1 RdgB/HAM1 family non-canonical purine NTP pyrophosphatase [Arenicellales bacterium]HCX88652.1 non-canonical purine NTP pyrophosphatase, RdgB/HAM1 family [Gammaproteobacteria bacterium]